MTKRRQLQERRRTLQTISELSATEHIPGFRTSIGHGKTTPHRLDSTLTRKSSYVSKRQSLPQYCGRPECIESRSPVPSTDTMLAQGAPLDREGHTSRTQPEVGWNARRARARMQAELALSANTVRREKSTTSLQAGSFHGRTNTPQLSRNKTSQPYLKSYYSQQHLIQDTRSMTSTPSRSDLTSSTGRPLRHSEHDGDSSEHTSTDASSFGSSRDSTMRRSRSSSSSQSFTVPGVPPLPTGCPQPTRSYYTAATSHYRNGYPIQLPGPMYVKAPSETRTSSLPYTRVDQYTTPLLGPMSPTPKNMSSSYFSVPPKPRPKSLSARSSSSHQQQVRHKRSSTITQPARYTTHKQPTSAPLPARPASTSSRHRASSLKSPSSSSKRAETVTFDQPPSVPNRQSLTKWRSEREEAKAEFNFMQRATMKERVRRANEMEREKERELQKVGLGAEKGARVLGKGLEGERGCFGGWGRMFGWVRGR